jgi:hypothetical protein
VNAQGTQLTVKNPAGIAGTAVDVRVLTPGGESAPVPADLFFYGPVVTSLSRTTGPVAGGAKLTITGRGFATVASVTFGSTPTTKFVVKSVGQIVVTAPPHPAGTVGVSVTALTGTSPSLPADLFTYG